MKQHKVIFHPGGEIGADNPKFMNEYISALFLPHTEGKRFPTIVKRLKWRDR